MISPAKRYVELIVVIWRQRLVNQPLMSNPSACRIRVRTATPAIQAATFSRRRWREPLGPATAVPAPPVAALTAESLNGRAQARMCGPHATLVRSVVCDHVGDAEA